MKLLTQEKIIYQTHPHLILIIVPIICIGLIWIFFSYFLCPLFEEYKNLCIKVLAVTFLFVILTFFLDWKNSLYFVTNLRITKQRGIVGKRTMSIWYAQIEDLSCQLSIFGEIIGFGDLIIESAGTYGNIKFKGMPLPRKVKSLIENELIKLRKGKVPQELYNFYLWQILNKS
ncbi:PH domain-containing protein [candidate division WOR-3 bacterium]|nr:PH domain-containing protein [candidate division WOR-3 bacterium]